jgi:hypothetical protein
MVKTYTPEKPYLYNQPMVTLKPARFAFVFLLIFTLYYSFVFVALPRMEAPIFSKFKTHYPLVNWNLPSHATGDFDGDGIQDQVLFSGCAFLSSTQAHTIPAEKQCAPEKNFLRGKTAENTLFGQKYSTTEIFDLSHGGFGAFAVKHSYLAQHQDGSWWLVVSEHGRLNVLTLNSDGLFVPVIHIPTALYWDEYAYKLSSYWSVLVLPLLPFHYVLSLPFMNTTASESMVPLQQIGLLLIMTLVSYVGMRVQKNTQPPHSTRD